jgi:CBS domain-containing protein
MKSYTVEDLMVPLSEYATVSEDASLYDAVLALDKAQQEFVGSHYKHRAILVYDKDNKIVGKISQLDVLKALEPKYRDMQDQHTGMARYGFSKKFMQSIMEQYELWTDPLIDICRKAPEIKVSKVMYTPSEKEYVAENVTLGEAVHMLVMGHHQSLLVTKGEDIIGILRLTDVFAAIIQLMHECQLEGT